MEFLRQRKFALNDKIESHSKLSGWALPQEPTSFADVGTWSNIDSDVTPPERRTWTSLTIVGFWCSDAFNAQGWEGPSSIIQAGLTWKEAFYLTVFGAMTDTIPLCLNGIIGARLHVPFPIAIRSSFGFYFSRFAVVTRMITALFWHAIQTWTGSTAMFQVHVLFMPTSPYSQPTDHQSYLAFFPRHPKSPPRERWNNNTGDDCPLRLLDRSIPHHAHTATQTKVFLLL